MVLKVFFGFLSQVFHLAPSSSPQDPYGQTHLWNHILFVPFCTIDTCNISLAPPPPSHADSLGFSGNLDGKESACNEGDLGSIPGLGRSPGEGNGYPLQYSGLENAMNR